MDDLPFPVQGINVDSFRENKSVIDLGSIGIQVQPDYSNAKPITTPLKQEVAPGFDRLSHCCL